SSTMLRPPPPPTLFPYTTLFRSQSPQVVRSTVADSWRWMWPDFLMRILPMTAVPFIYIAILRLPPSFLGITFHDIPQQVIVGLLDRKSTRLNSSHVKISYAVFCL